MEYESESDTNCSWCTWNGPKRIGKRVWKSEEGLKPIRTLHCCNLSEYSEESWRHEETCCLSDSSERPSANADVKTQKEQIIIVKKDRKRVWKVWKSEEGLIPFRTLHCCNLPEYSEESWRPEETCCHSDSSERPSANADVKTQKG